MRAFGHRRKSHSGGVIEVGIDMSACNSKDEIVIGQPAQTRWRSDSSGFATPSANVPGLPQAGRSGTAQTGHRAVRRVVEYSWNWMRSMAGQRVETVTSHAISSSEGLARAAFQRSLAVNSRTTAMQPPQSRPSLSRRHPLTPRMLTVIGAVAIAATVAHFAAMPHPAAHAAGEKARTAASPRGTMTFASPEVAYDQGVAAARGGRLEIAIDAFEYAGKHNHVPALYYLGTIYANNDERVTDHAKAFNVFHQLVAKYAYVDPRSDFRSIYVVRAAVRLAAYYRSGVPALGLKPDPREAVELLFHAATYFGDLDAQFQLAKMYLTGDGVEGNESYGLHWLSSLARKNHAGAQAFLAELLWRGKFVRRDARQALVWSTLSLEAAGDQDRIWIEEIYQTIYCGAAPGVREKAGQLVADWRKRAPATTGSVPDHVEDMERTVSPDRAGRGRQGGGGSNASAGMVRTCANGEPVPTVTTPERPGSDESAALPTMPGGAPAGTGRVGPVVGPLNSQPGGVAQALAPASTTAPASAIGTPTPPFGQGFREFEKDDGTGRSRR